MDSLRDSREIERIAADWLAKRDSGSWTESDETEFLCWQRESTLHRVAVIRLKSIWQHADRLQALGAGVPSGRIPPPGQWRTSPFFDGRLKAPVSATSVLPDEELVDPKTAKSSVLALFLRHRALAAALILVATSGIAWYFLNQDPNTYRTAIGDSQSVHLADGSQVILNTDSQIHVALTGTERRVEVNRGEVFFDVVKEPTRPFVVRAGDKRVVVVGTKFSVLRSPNDLRVVVTEGKVLVEDLSRENAEPTLQLTAGNIARASASGLLVTGGSIPQAEQALSWRSGYIVLRDTALADAVAEFNRYNERKLVLADSSLASLRIGGNLRPTNLDAFVRVLEQGFPIQAESSGDRIVLRRR